MAPTFQSSNGIFKLEWVDLGEGWEGDYHPDDPEDTPLLRADLYMRGEGGEWEFPEDASYCTMAPVYTSAEVLQAISEHLFSMLGDRFHKRSMEMWTWHTNPAKLGREYFAK